MNNGELRKQYSLVKKKRKHSDIRIAFKDDLGTIWINKLSFGNDIIYLFDKQGRYTGTIETLLIERID